MGWLNASRSWSPYGALILNWNALSCRWYTRKTRLLRVTFFGKFILLTFFTNLSLIASLSIVAQTKFYLTSSVGGFLWRVSSTYRSSNFPLVKAYCLHVEIFSLRSTLLTSADTQILFALNSLFKDNIVHASTGSLVTYNKGLFHTPRAI